jgi:hypothetical protein
VNPAPDCFGGVLNAALCQEILDVAMGERESEVHPDRSPDDVGGTKIATVSRRGHTHPRRRRLPAAKPAGVTNP